MMDPLQMIDEHKSRSSHDEGNMTAIAIHPTNQKLFEKENHMPGNGDAEEMPEGFAPSEFDVLVGWARQNFHHAGNRRFRDVISENVQRYMEADSKVARGQIITEIVKQMQSKSPSGTGFLKLNPYSAKWTFIGTDKAKDKVGHALRKAVMNVQENGGDQEERSDSYKSKGSQKASKLSQRESPAPVLQPSSPRSKKRKASAPVSILKRGRNSRFEMGSIPPDMNETELVALSKLFSSPGTLTVNRRFSTSAENLSYGLSPVGRDMFDEKNEDRQRRGRRSQSPAEHPPPGVPPPPQHPVHVAPASPSGAHLGVGSTRGFIPNHPFVVSHLAHYQGHGPLSSDHPALAPPTAGNPLLGPPAGSVPPPPPVPPPMYFPPGYYFYPGYGPLHGPPDGPPPPLYPPYAPSYAPPPGDVPGAAYPLEYGIHSQHNGGYVEKDSRHSSSTDESEE